jgi:hypothetical protein
LFFASPKFRRADFDGDSRVATPLGFLARNYRGAEHILTLEREGHEIPETGARFNSWASAEIRLEELQVSAKLSTPQGVVEGHAVLIRSEALADAVELRASVVWQTGYQWTEVGPCSGEGLEAVTWNDAANRVTVGTEDAEYLAARAQRGDWMPRRLEPWFQGIEFSKRHSNLIQVTDTSLTIGSPPLRQGERVQLQFVIASAATDDRSATWFAVDRKPNEILALAGCE